MRLFLHEVRTQQLVFWRSFEAAFFIFALPIVFFVLLGSVYGGDRIEGVKGSEYLLAGMLGYSVVSVSFAGVAIRMVVRRELGILKRLRATPLPAPTFLSAALASDLLVFALDAVTIVVLGRLLFGIGFPSRIGSLVLALLLSAVCFAALGFGVTSVIRSAEGSSAVVNAIYLPMAFISGSFFSPHSFPGFLRAIADVLPLTYVIRLLRGIVLHGDQIWSRPGDVGVLVLWGAIGLVAAVRGFRWEPREV